MKNSRNSYDASHDCWLTVGKAFLKCQRTMNKLLSDLDITIAQHEILLSLHHNDAMTHKELSERLLVVKSNVSNLIKKLEQRNLVKITPCIVDHRVKRLSLTRNGSLVVKKSSEIQKAVVTTMMQGLSSSDISVTNRVMMSALNSLDEIA